VPARADQAVSSPKLWSARLSTVNIHANLEPFSPKNTRMCNGHSGAESGPPSPALRSRATCGSADASSPGRSRVDSKQVPLNCNAMACIRLSSRSSAGRESVKSQEEVLPQDWVTSFALDPFSPVIGKGAFAQIFKVLDCTSGVPAAVKVMERSFYVNRGIEKQMMFEISALQRSVTCSHVLRVQDVLDEGDKVFIRTEFCGGGDLLGYAMRKPGKLLAENEASPWAAQLCMGLSDLHAINIIHRDIKPENLLLTQDGVLKIADFGWAVDLRERPSNLAGTFCYMAPEVLEEVEEQTTAVDVWSAGASFTELLTGLTLKDAVDKVRDEDHHSVNMAMRDRFLKAAKTYPPREEARPSHVSSECWDCLRSMLIVDSSLRATLPAALRHAWLRNHHQRGLVSGRSTLPSSQVIGFGPHANVRTSMRQPPLGSRVSPIRSGTITARGLPGELRFKRAL